MHRHKEMVATPRLRGLMYVAVEEILNVRRT